ncbi:Hypothetical protein RAK1035_0807 [Roseovarius sp. AK1035]|nr:Hypothetical protein RAK1035_0807 [Roseovarius sp. AK1035]
MWIIRTPKQATAKSEPDPQALINAIIAELRSFQYFRKGVFG